MTQKPSTSLDDVSAIRQKHNTIIGMYILPPNPESGGLYSIKWLTTTQLRVVQWSHSMAYRVGLISASQESSGDPDCI